MIRRISIDGNEPITLEEAKDQCYVTGSRFDSLLDSLIATAREYAENQTWRTFVDSTYVQTEDKVTGIIELQRPPVVSVEKIEVKGSDGNYSEITDYTADTDSEYGRIEPTAAMSSASGMNAVKITFKAGYENDDEYSVLESATQAMKLMIKHWYDNRSEVLMSEGQTVDVKEIPLGAQMLLDNISSRVYV